MLARVSRIGREAVALIEAVAVLGGRGELRHGAALAALEQDAAAGAVDALSQIGVLRTTRPLQFVHPLVHAAVYEAIPPGRRSLAHKAAASLLAAEGASPDRGTASTERRARRGAVGRGRLARSSSCGERRGHA